MKRFNFEEDDEDDDEEYYEESEEMSMDMDFEDHLLAMTHFPMENDNLLPSAIQVCEKSLFWRFRSLSYKVKKIRMVYLALKDFIEEEKITGEI